MERNELSWHERGRLWLRLGIRAVLVAGVLLMLFLALPPLLSIFMPFVLAFLVAWLLNPVVRVMQKRIGVSRNLLTLFLILLVFGVTGGILFLLFYYVGSELFALANNWQGIWDGVRGTIDQVGGVFSGLHNLLPANIAATVDALLERFYLWFQTGISGYITRFAAQAGNWAIGIPSFFITLVVFIMGTYFITADYPHLRFKVTERLSPESRAFFRMLKTTAGTAFGGYVHAQFILTIGVFLILLLGFILTRQTYAFLLAFLLAVLDFIPIVGAGTAMVPWALTSLFTGDLRKAVSLMVVWGVVVLFRRVGEPKVLGSQTGLSPILSLVSIYVGMQVGGVTGMILGPILCLIFLNVLRSGAFDGASADLHLAMQDIGALLKNRPNK